MDFPNAVLWIGEVKIRAPVDPDEVHPPRLGDCRHEVDLIGEIDATGLRFQEGIRHQVHVS